MNRVRRRTGATACLVLVVAGLAGCSQVDALVPVSGGPESVVRVAAIDVLLREDVGVLVAPSCAADAARTVITCTGRSVGDEPIAVTAQPSAPYEMSVTVGDQEIYRGSAQDVLDEASRS